VSGRTVLVAGASAGIGAALVRALGADGDRVFACARRGDALARVTRDDTLARSRVADVTDEAQVRALVEWIGAETPALDALVVCAGGFGAIGSFETTDSDQWWATLRSNVLPLYLLAKHALPLLERGRGRRIVAFSSGVAYSPFPRYSGYAVSKAAVIRLAASLADELAGRIAVNVVLPGMVATEIHAETVAAGPQRAGPEHFERTRALLDGGGVPMEVPVDCVRFLLSPDADGLTGKTIAANFDPWRRLPALGAKLDELSRSPLYTVRRIMPADLPAGSLKELLS
jgi:3-oxoacyl-[acyl-carrier protein] reductase